VSPTRQRCWWSSLSKNSNRAVTCLIGTALLVACRSGSTPAADTGSATSATTIQTIVTSFDSATLPGSHADDTLEALLITSVPDGFRQVDDSEADTGPSDLEKAAKDDGGGADSTATLSDAGFVSGYQRAWQTDDQRGVIILFLYEFSTQYGAESYGERLIALFDSEPTLEAVPFDVDGVPNATGRSMTSLEADARLSSSVVFYKNGFLVQVVVISPTDTEGQTLVQQLAIDQFSRL